mmetsp:Transcript_7832/g.12527  ORF Transcript_7832/g.12527 Transcript_7832/m.12527 type:complete len:1243 (-) Transcript_7832:83-3811(-)
MTASTSFYVVIHGTNCSSSVSVSVSDLTVLLDSGVYAAPLEQYVASTFNLCDGLMPQWTPGEYTVLVHFTVQATGSYTFMVNGVTAGIDVFSADRSQLWTGYNYLPTFALSQGQSIIIVVHSSICGTSTATLSYYGQTLSPCFLLPNGPRLRLNIPSQFNGSFYFIPMQSPLSSSQYGTSSQFIAPNAGMFTFTVQDTRFISVENSLALVDSSCNVIASYTGFADLSIFVSAYLQARQTVYLLLYGNQALAASVTVSTMTSACGKYSYAGAVPIGSSDGISFNLCNYPATGGSGSYAAAIAFTSSQAGLYTLTWWGDWSSSMSVYTISCGTLLGTVPYTTGNDVTVYASKAGETFYGVLTLPPVADCLESDTTVTALYMPAGCAQVWTNGALSIGTAVEVSLCDHPTPLGSVYGYYAVQFNVNFPAGLYLISAIEKTNSIIYDHSIDVLGADCSTPIVPLIDDGRLFYASFPAATSAVVIISAPSRIACGPVDVLVTAVAGTPTFKPSPLPSQSPTPTPTPSPTSTPTVSDTPTESAPPTFPPTQTPLPTPTFAPSETPSQTPAPTPGGCANLANGGALSLSIPLTRNTTEDLAPNNFGFGAYATLVSFTPSTSGLYNILITGDYYSVRNIYNDIYCTPESQIFNAYTTGSTLTSLDLRAFVEYYVIVFGMETGILTVSASPITELCSKGVRGPELSLIEDTRPTYDLCQLSPTSPQSWLPGERTVLFPFTATTPGLYTFTVQGGFTPDLNVLDAPCTTEYLASQNTLSLQLNTSEVVYVVAHSAQCGVFTVIVDSRVSGCSSLTLKQRLTPGFPATFDNSEDPIGSDSVYFPDFTYGTAFDLIATQTGLYTFIVNNVDYSYVTSHLAVLNSSCSPIMAYTAAPSYDASVTVFLTRGSRPQAVVLAQQPTTSTISVSVNNAACNRYAYAGVLTNISQPFVNLCSYPSIGGERNYAAAFPFRATKTGLWIFSWIGASDYSQQLDVIDSDCKSVLGSSTLYEGGQVVVAMVQGEVNIAVVSAGYGDSGCVEVFIMTNIAYLPSGCAKIAQGQGNLTAGPVTENLCEDYAPSNSPYGRYAAQFDYVPSQSGQYSFVVSAGADAVPYDTTTVILGGDCQTPIATSNPENPGTVTVSLTGGTRVYVVVYSDTRWGCGGAIVLSAIFEDSATFPAAAKRSLLSTKNIRLLSSPSSSLLKVTLSESNLMFAVVIVVVLAGVAILKIQKRRKGEDGPITTNVPRNVNSMV